MKINFSNKFKFFSLLLASCLTFESFGQSAPAAAPKALEKHENLFASNKFLTVQFTQTIYRKLRNKTTERKGTASFAKPTKFYWHFENDKAGDEEYFYDGTSLNHFIAREKLLKRYSSTSGLARQLQDVIDMVLDGKALLSRYNVQEIKNEKDSTLATLLPKIDDPSNDIKKIEVKISDERKFIKEVKISYADESYSTFKFKNPRTKEIPPTRFAFQKPQGMTITEKTVQ
jgi:outer membrane lipoprotein-sorting protein